MASENPREIVLDALLLQEKEEGHSNRLIAAVLEKYDYLPQRDKAFIKRLFEGTLESRITLDYCLNRVSKTPVRKMKPLIRTLLRMGTYQLLFMDGAEYAAVSECVRIAKKRGMTSLSGFVNGVLRGLLRELEANGGKIPMPDPEKDVREYLSVRYSVPLFTVDIFLAEFGEEKAEKILAALSRIYPVSLRIRTDLGKQEKEQLLSNIGSTGAVLRQSSVCEDIYLMEEGGSIQSLPGFAEGLFAVQDAASARAVRAAGIRPGDRILDCCAAPGGKSILASELTGSTGSVLSGDVSEEKAARIRENAERMHAENVTAVVRDASVPIPSEHGTYDVVLLDVPCSGLGILGKKRDIKYRLGEEDLSSLKELQRKILTASLPYVKVGGSVLYSTCTLRKAENEEQVAWICENFPFEPAGKSELLLPDELECDGFFYAVLTRTGE